MLLYNLYFGQIVILIIYNLCLSIVDAEQHRIIRATMKQKVEEGDESEIANMAEITAKGIICYYIIYILVRLLY